MRSRHRLAGSLVAALVVLSAALTGGCTSALETHVARSPAMRESSVQIEVHGEPLTLHLASPRTPSSPSQPIVLYASGDGGWFGAAVGMFRTIAGGGHPTAGFSTKTLLQIERHWSTPVTVAHLVEGYQQIMTAARAHLQLPPDTPVVLSGWSRGASLGVLVASHHQIDPRVMGVVAIGLAANDALDLEGDTDDDAADATGLAVSAGVRARVIAMYPRLPRIAPRRLVVIQASGDGYLPAARARELFGADSTTRRLRTIEARNHRFDGGEASFAAALVESMAWVSTSTAAPD